MAAGLWWRSLRWATVVSATLDLAVAALGAALVAAVLRGCGWRHRAPALAAAATAAAKFAVMTWTGIAQAAVASVVARRAIGEPLVADDGVFRRLRKMRYKRWLWWTRFGMVVTSLQFVVALYLICVFAKDFSSADGSTNCMKAGGVSDHIQTLKQSHRKTTLTCFNNLPPFYVQGLNNGGWKKILTISFLVLACLVVIVQCSTGSNVLRWRSFYTTHDTAWKAHYDEVFDHGIREVLCCLGRVKYRNILEEDEVYYVARLLGELVAYRASGIGHLELLAGLALLQKDKQSSMVYAGLAEAPDVQLREAAVFHKFAEAAYTGPLLDFGRNPILFPCVWLYRQGVLSPWSRNRRPTLEGDNWWRGHAAAFLKYVGMPPEALRHGRVSQTKRQAAYFIIVIHDLKSVVISVRGTETPEDLITDGLCKNCSLSMDDLDGIINSDQIPQTVKDGVLSSFPHYGHSGIVEYARELYMQIDGQPADKDDLPPDKSGFLSSLMGTGCECYGYKIRIVGHSLGGSVAALLGMRLYARYPNLHVYSYGALPCVDLVVAEACSDFVTCIVLNDEFSARLSVNSILRLRVAAVGAISNDSSTNSAMVTKIPRNILHAKKSPGNEKNCNASPSLEQSSETAEDAKHVCQRNNLKYTMKGSVFLCGQTVSCMMNMPNRNPSSRIMSHSKTPTRVTSEINGLSTEGPQTFAARSRQSDRQLYQDEVYLFDKRSSESPPEGFNVFNHSQLSGAVQFDKSNDLFHFDDKKSSFVDDTSSNFLHFREKLTEAYIAGLIIHIVHVQKSTSSTRKSCLVSEYDYKAFVAKRESFKDIVVSPYMFLDHLPWRCHYAIEKALQSRKQSGQVVDDVFHKEDIV